MLILLIIRLEILLKHLNQGLISEEIHEAQNSSKAVVIDGNAIVHSMQQILSGVLG